MVLAVIAMLAFLWLLVVNCKLIIKNFEEFEKEEFKNKFGAYYGEFKTGNKLAALYSVLFMIQRLIISLALILFYQYPLV